VDTALGLQKSFNWQAVAAATVSAPLANYAALKTSVAVGIDLDNVEAGNLAGQATSSLIKDVTYDAFTGGKLTGAQIAADAFGTVLGNSLADQLYQPPAPPTSAQPSSSTLNSSQSTQQGTANTSQAAPGTSTLTNNPANS